MDHHNFEGKEIPHIKLDSKMTIKELVEIYASSGFNGRQLGEAAKLYSKMIHDDATICLTVAGAMTPVVAVSQREVALADNTQPDQTEPKTLEAPKEKKETTKKAEKPAVKKEEKK